MPIRHGWLHRNTEIIAIECMKSEWFGEGGVVADGVA